MLESTLKESDDKMNKAVEVVKHNLAALRTGRASTHLVDGILVKAYGTESPLNQISTVTTPDATTVAIQPWDKNILSAIEKAILQANIGITPTNDGKIVRLSVPPLTEETRKEMVKQAHHIAEEGRVAIRNIRRHVNEEIKKAEKDHKVSEDDSRKTQQKVQDKTDASIKHVDEWVAAKEKEIMTV